MAILKIDNLNYRLPNGRELYRDFSLELTPSSGILIYGPNGSGKSSLVKILLGLIRNYHGSVEILGRDIGHMSPAGLTRVRCHIGLQLEEPVVFEELNLLRNISTYLGICRCKRNKSEILNILYENGFSGVRNKKLGALSWGEIRMVEIIRILLKSPRLVICDQPFAALDENAMAWLAGKFRSLTASGTAILATFSRPEVQRYLDWPEIKLSE